MESRCNTNVLYVSQSELDAQHRLLAAETSGSVFVGLVWPVVRALFGTPDSDNQADFSHDRTRTTEEKQ